MRRVLVRECAACGATMQFAGRYKAPLRRHWRCPACGSWVSVLVRDDSLYRERWRKML